MKSKLLIMAMLIVLAFACAYEADGQGFPAPAQPAQTGATQTNNGKQPAFLRISYARTIDESFKADGNLDEFGWYVYSVPRLNVPLVGQIGLDVGPFVSYLWHSGELNDGLYSEKFVHWKFGIVARINSTNYSLTLIPTYGILVNDLTRFTGTVEHFRQDKIWGIDLRYKNFYGRTRNRRILPAGGVDIFTSTAAGSGVPSDLSFQFSDLTRRIEGDAPNLENFHFLVYLDLVDIPYSSRILQPLTFRFLGGKFDAFNKYYGLGAGTTIMLRNNEMLSVSLDRLWNVDSRNINGQVRGEMSNWTFNLNVNFGGILQFWQTL